MYKIPKLLSNYFHDGVPTEQFTSSNVTHTMVQQHLMKSLFTLPSASQETVVSQHHTEVSPCKWYPLCLWCCSPRLHLIFSQYSLAGNEKERVKIVKCIVSGLAKW